jgi:hypothetical protein
MSKRFFFEKKKQKTFATLGQGPFHRHGLNVATFFLLLFCSQKRSAFFLTYASALFVFRYCQKLATVQFHAVSRLLRCPAGFGRL